MSKWIPVTEDRPGPEEEGRYLVTVANEEYEGPDITVAFYELGGRWLPDFFIRSDTVTAWMPLPESYKEAEQ